MPLRTTVNINQETLMALEKSAIDLGLSVNSIAMYLLEKYAQKRGEKIYFGSTIRYQKRDGEKKWKCHHITFSEDMHQFCQEMRCFFKLSVSHMLALAVEMFLEEFQKEASQRGKVDNYPLNSWIFAIDESSTAPIFIHSWGYPEKIPRYVLEIFRRAT